MWELYAELLKPAVTLQWGWDEAFQRKNFSEHLPFSLFTIIEYESTSVAAYAWSKVARQIDLHMLLVVQEHQMKGLGSQVLEGIKKRASILQLPIELTVFPANPVAGFYLKNGFRLVDASSDKNTYRWAADENR